MSGTPHTVNARQEQLTRVYERFFPAPTQEGELTPRPGIVAIEDDEELLEKARAASGGSGAEFVDLFDKGIVPEGKSHSEADWRLLRKLAFWTGGDFERMMHLFRQSALYRPPPEKHAGYVRGSVEKLLAEYEGDYYDPERRTREAREAIERRLAPRRKAEPWKSLAGQTDRALYDALLYAGMDGYGVAKERGVEIKIAYRELAERAGISLRSVSNSLRRLEERELIERVRAEKGKKQGRILVLFAAPEDEKHFGGSEASPQACPIRHTQGVSTEEVSTEGEECSPPYGARLWRYLDEGSKSTASEVRRARRPP